MKAINPHVESLFQLTRSQVTEQHIVDYSPGDPGYPEYVRLWTKIYQTGEIPKRVDFHLSEVIMLVGYTPATNFDNPKLFREYRRFTSAVAVSLIDSGNEAESVRIPNYLARDLLIDTDIVERTHFDAVRKILPVVRATLMTPEYEDECIEEEYPFFTFALMILAQMAGDQVELVRLAAQLIDDDASVRKDTSPWDSRLLLGLTNYNQLNSDWVRMASVLRNPTNDENLQLVIDALSE